MKDYYEILEVNINVSEDEIYNAYNLKISQFNHLPFFTSKMIKEIKTLKEAIYVLGNKKKREIYNKKYNLNLKYKKEEDIKEFDNTKIYNRLFSTALLQNPIF
jgi:DnaJ-class molecular chaperone